VEEVFFFFFFFCGVFAYVAHFQPLVINEVEIGRIVGYSNPTSLALTTGCIQKTTKRGQRLLGFILEEG
jgi:hypothetical protein